MNHDTLLSTKANILVVDDTRDNLRLLSGILTEYGYQVRPVSDGHKALSAARAKPPDLILLDIMMPGMDGYEVCEHLKADERTQDVPIIFISALNETFDKVKAFSLGGVDYITKPFQTEEVLARVKTHVNLRRIQKSLETEIVERKRAEEALREANASKDKFFSIIAHDLRSPFTALLGYTELALRYPDETSKEKMRNHITHIKTSAESVYALLENLLTWSRLQRGMMEHRPENFPLPQTVEHVVDLFASSATQKQITLRNSVPSETSVHADVNMIHTVIRNFVSNALKFTKTGGRIEIIARQHDEYVEIAVSDTGIGIPENALAKLFRIDTKLTTKGTAGERGTGLGLSLCKDLIEKNKGTLNVESEVGKGTTFRFTLPSPKFSQGLPLQSKTELFSEPPGDEHRAHHIRVTDVDRLAPAIAALPKAWQTELQDAADTLNVDEVKSLITQISEHDAPLAETLTNLVENYRFGVLQQAFEKMT